MGMHRENKVQFCMGEQVRPMSGEFEIFKIKTQVAEFIGSEGRLTGVRLRYEVFAQTICSWTYVDMVTRHLKL